ncbi:MAG: four helix bundle protein [Bacteroidota bacterium]
MKENLIQEKSFVFAVRIIKMYQHLTSEKKEFILTKQVLRSGTSIGANIEEALGGSSKKDFTAKLRISYKECRETKYWLRLLNETGYLNKEEFQSIFNDCDELGKLLYSIINNIKTK